MHNSNTFCARNLAAFGARAGALALALAGLLSVVLGLNALLVAYATRDGDGGVRSLAAALGAVLIGVPLRRLRARGRRSETYSVRHMQHGSANFAPPLADMLTPAGAPLPPGSIYLAPNGNTDVYLPQQVAVQHVLINGPSGSGKTRFLIMPSAARMRATSAVFSDPKGELWEHCSGGFDTALRFAPGDPGRSEPFNFVRACEDTSVALKLASAFMQQDEDVREMRFFKVCDQTFAAAVLQYAALSPVPTPLTAYKILELEVFHLMRFFAESKSELARRYAADMAPFEEGDSKLVAGIKMSVSQQFQKVLGHEAVQRFTSASLKAPDFTILRRMPTAVFLVQSENDLTDRQPLISVFYTLLLHQLSQEEDPEHGNRIQVRLLLDEFYNSGKIPGFVNMIGVTRYRNISITIVVQALSQLKRYGEDGAAIIRNNCLTKIALHGLEVEDAKYFERLLGDKTHHEQRISVASTGKSGKTITDSPNAHRRPLMTADEITRLGSDEMIVRTGNRRPMKLQRVYYDAPPNPARTRALGEALYWEPPAEQQKRKTKRTKRPKSVPPSLPEA